MKGRVHNTPRTNSKTCCADGGGVSFASIKAKAAASEHAKPGGGQGDAKANSKFRADGGGVGSTVKPYSGSPYSSAKGFKSGGKCK